MTKSDQIMEALTARLAENGIVKIDRTIPHVGDWIFESSMPEPNTGCWLWTKALNVWGYASSGGLSESGKRGTFAVHRESYMKSNGQIPNGMVVRHKCDQPSCVNPEHLTLGTNADNVQDMLDRKRKPSKFTDEQFAAALADKEGTYRQRGERHGINSVYLWQVENGYKRTGKVFKGRKSDNARVKKWPNGVRKGTPNVGC